MTSNVFSTPGCTPTQLSSESYSTYPVLAISKAKIICLAMEKKNHVQINSPTFLRHSRKVKE